MSENNYKKLVYNTAIFAVGNFGSKILTFLIVPLYTYVLTTAEYGTIDLFITSLGMVIPFSTMMVNEALIRFVLGKRSGCLWQVLYFISCLCFLAGQWCGWKHSKSD